MEDDKGGYRQINKSLNICAFEDYLQGQTARLPQLADVEQLTPRVLRILGQNPGRFTFQGTNTYVIGTGPARLLIDTGGGEPEWAELIAKTLSSMNITLSHVLLTHWHGDHTGGVPNLLARYPNLHSAIYKHTPDPGQQPILHAQRFCVPGATVRAVHTPGHSEDHVCFVLEEENAMFTGDNVLGTGTSAVEDLGIFMDSLAVMRDQHCQTGHSAHGAVIEDLPAKLNQEIAGKLRRERQVLQTLHKVKVSGEKSVTVKDLVVHMYGENVDPATRELALEPFMDEVLRKLAGDGKVAFEKRAGVKKWFSLAKPAAATPHPAKAGGLKPLTAIRAC